MTRVIAYIDGFNLYFGLRSKGWRKYYWLDLARLASVLIKPTQRLEAIHYFTSRIVPHGYNTCDISRQNTYLEALSTLPQLPARLERTDGRTLERPEYWC